MNSIWLPAIVVVLSIAGWTSACSDQGSQKPRSNVRTKGSPNSVTRAEPGTAEKVHEVQPEIKNESGQGPDSDSLSSSGVTEKPKGTFQLIKSFTPGSGEVPEIGVKTRAFFEPDSGLYLASPSGLSWFFLYEQKEFQEKIPPEESDSYELLYNLAEFGWVAFNQAEFSYATPDAESLSRAVLPEFLADARILSLNAQSLALKSKSDHQFYQLFFAGGSVSFVQVKSDNINLLHFSPCKTGCSLWSFDGQQFYYNREDNALWQPVQFDFTLPEGFILTTMAGTVSLQQNGRPDYLKIFALDQENRLWELSLTDVKEAPALLK